MNSEQLIINTYVFARRVFEDLFLTPYGLIALGVLILIIAIQWKLNLDKYGKRKEKKEVYRRPRKC